MTEFAPTPYDTGERLEPVGWLPYGTPVTEVTPAENFGKVDFDEDGGDTVVVAHVERTAGGSYVMHVTPLCGEDDFTIELHLGDGITRGTRGCPRLQPWGEVNRALDGPHR